MATHLPAIEGLRELPPGGEMEERSRERSAFAVLRVDEPSANIPPHPRSPTRPMYERQLYSTGSAQAQVLRSRKDKEITMRYGTTEVGLPIVAPTEPLSTFDEEGEVNYLEDPQYRYQRSKQKHRAPTDFNILTAPTRPSLLERREMDLNIGMNFDSLDYLEEELGWNKGEERKKSLHSEVKLAQAAKKPMREHKRSDAPRLQKKDGEEMTQEEYEAALKQMDSRQERIRAKALQRARRAAEKRHTEEIRPDLDTSLATLVHRTQARAKERQEKEELVRFLTPRRPPHRRREDRDGRGRGQVVRRLISDGGSSHRLRPIESMNSVKFAEEPSIVSLVSNDSGYSSDHDQHRLYRRRGEYGQLYVDDDDDDDLDDDEDEDDSSYSSKSWDSREFDDNRLFHQRYDHYTDLGGKELRVLSREFKKIGQDFGIREDEFVELFLRVLNFTPAKLHWLFQKIDADANGVMTWNEFTGFLLASNETIQEAMEYPHQLSETPAQLGTGHRQMIDIVLCLTERGQVLTAGRDFAVNIWDAHTFKPVRRMDMSEFGPKDAYMMSCSHAGHQKKAGTKMDDTWQVGIGKRYHDPREFLKQVSEGKVSLKSADMLDNPEAALQAAYESIAASKQPKFYAHKRPTSVAARKCVEPAPNYTAWVTAICYNSVAEEVVIATVDGKISLYDSRGFHRLNQFQAEHVPTCISVCDVFHHGQVLPADAEDVVGYVVGDDRGFVTGYCKISPWNKLHQYSHSKVHKEHAPEIKQPKRFQLDRTVHISVTQAQQIPGLGVISSDNIGMLVLCDPERWNFMRVFKGHEKEITAFTYCPSNRILASGGLDRVVRVWNPFLGTPIANLTGHRTPIVNVFCNDKLLQFISVSEDKTIKLWDIRNLQCVQTLLDDTRHVPQNKLTSAAFDPATQRLITAGSALRVWPVDHDGSAHELKRRFKAGDGTEVQGSVIFVGFSDHFNLLVCVTMQGHVSSWDVSGQVCMYAFVAEHVDEQGDLVQITAACLDTARKRVVTAAHDGTMKKWNFNNGNMLYELAPDEVKREITCMSSLDAAITEYEIVGGLWGGVMKFWPTEEDQETVGCKETVGHRGDVTALATHGGSIATGGADGRVIIWEAESFKVRGAAQMPAPAGIKIPVESLLILPHHGMMVVGCVDGMLHLVSFLGRCEVIAAGVENLADSVTCMAADEKESRLATCNASGDMYVWSIKNLCKVNEDGEREGDTTLEPRRFHRRAHGCSITSIVALEAPSIFVTGCSGGAILLWTWTGARLGSLSPNEGPYLKTLPYLRGTLDDVKRERHPEDEQKQFGQLQDVAMGAKKEKMKNKRGTSKLDRIMKLREASIKNLAVHARQVEEKKRTKQYVPAEQKLKEMTVTSLHQRLVTIKNRFMEQDRTHELPETIARAHSMGYRRVEESVTTPQQRLLQSGGWRG